LVDRNEPARFSPRQKKILTVSKKLLTVRKNCLPSENLCSLNKDYVCALFLTISNFSLTVSNFFLTVSKFFLTVSKFFLTVSNSLLTVIHMIIAPAYALLCVTTTQNGNSFHREVLRGFLLFHDSLCMAGRSGPSCRTRTSQWGYELTKNWAAHTANAQNGKWAYGIPNCIYSTAILESYVVSTSAGCRAWHSASLHNVSHVMAKGQMKLFDM
jgi:hypothetical protein